jgi:hypothetical protein
MVKFSKLSCLKDNIEALYCLHLISLYGFLPMYKTQFNTICNFYIVKTYSQYILGFTNVYNTIYSYKLKIYISSNVSSCIVLIVVKIEIINGEIFFCIFLNLHEGSMLNFLEFVYLLGLLLCVIDVIFIVGSLPCVVFSFPNIQMIVCVTGDFFILWLSHTSSEITFKPLVLINQSFSGDTSTDWCDIKSKTASIMLQAAANAMLVAVIQPSQFISKLSLLRKLLNFITHSRILSSPCIWYWIIPMLLTYSNLAL